MPRSIQHGVIEQTSVLVTEVLFRVHAQNQEEIHKKKGLFAEKKTPHQEGLSRMWAPRSQSSPFPVLKQGRADRRRRRESQEVI